MRRADKFGRHGNGWPLVSGRPYGDAHVEVGDQASIYAVIKSDGQTAIGMAGIGSDLRRPS